ncbi:hypothetical protein M153_36470001314 [Pseudoloma neurophilia]|uniref:Uncharacterized protein n=1 Tax=Pseudoloma neurophilia TaxID=146866 RepID=A0A0R0LZ54_9MICR|nr:hypothetical protein M153_36470001314 [Pseudoloma neurophilia]
MISYDNHQGKNLNATNIKVPNLKSVFVRYALGKPISDEQGNIFDWI